MLSKNNFYQRELKRANKQKKFALRKLSIGVASVAVASVFYFGGAMVTAQADAAPEVVKATTPADHVATETDTSIQNGVTASGQVVINGADRPDGQLGVSNSTGADYSYRVDIDKGTFKAGDTLTLTFEELGSQSNVMKELVSDDGIPYAKLISNTQTYVNGDGNTSYWSQRNDNFTAQEKLAFDIKARGSRTVFTYQFNENIEAMDKIHFEQSFSNALLVPRVNVDKSLESRILVNNVPVVTKPIVVNAEPLQTLKSAKTTANSGGVIVLNDDGEMTGYRTTVQVNAREQIPEGSLIEITLNDNELSSFAQVGPLKEGRPQTEGGFSAPGAIVNDDDVILFAKRTSPLMEVVSVEPKKLVLRLKKGTMEPGMNYRFNDIANDLGVDRVFSDDTMGLIKDAVANGKGGVSVDNGKVTITTPDNNKLLDGDNADVNWNLKYPQTLVANSGAVSALQGNVLVHYVDEYGNKIIPSEAAVNTKDGLLVDHFKATEPANDYKLQGNAKDSGLNVKATDENGTKTYNVTVPYIVQGNNNNYYRFTGYVTDGKMYADEATEGVVSLKQKHVVAAYQQVEFAHVNIALVDEAGNLLDKEIKTKYDGVGDPTFTSMVGNDYDVSDVKVSPKLEKDGKTYILDTENLPATKGTITKNPLTVKYVYKLSDKDTHDPVPGKVEVKQGTKITEKDITDQVTIPNMPEKTTVAVKDPATIPATDTPGDKGTVTVVVKYPDGTSEDVEVPVNVTPTQAYEHEPKLTEEGNGLSVPQHSTKITEDNILAEVDVPNMPTDTKLTVADPTEIPSTDEVVNGAKVKVIVSYPDGSEDSIDVPVTVTPVTVTGGEITVRQGDSAITSDQIKNNVTLKDAPAGTTMEVTGEIPTTDTPSTKVPVEVTVTYPNGTTEKTTVLVTVTPNDAETHEPTTDGVKVPEGTPLTNDDITDKVTIPDMPEHTTITVKDPATVPATDTPGDKGTVTVVVTYPDGSKDEIEVPVVVTPLPAADKHEPKGQDVNTTVGNEPNASDAIENKDDLPEGTKFEWKDTPDVSTTVDKPATVVVTYPDGSQEEVEVTVHVTDPRTDADKHEPKGQDVDVTIGNEPNASDAIENGEDLPEGTTIEWKDTPDVSTPGDKTAIVVVTYPDGSQEEVEVTIHVTDPRTDADKHEPKGHDLDTNLNGQPSADDAIENKDDLPEGTKFEWKDTPDTSTTGDKPSVVVVTYPDGSQEEVEVTVHVTDPRTDADKHEPKGQDVNVTIGNEPNANDAIENGEDLPEGTTVEWKDTPDVSTPGDKTGIVVVTYPDGSQEEVEVTIHVTDPRTDADKHEPKGQDVDATVGNEPNASDAIENGEDLPEGTTIEWKDTPDVSTPGDKTAIVVVTYPDGSQEEVEVTVHVTDPRTDADKHEPKGQDLDTNLNGQPSADDAIENKDDLPEGTKFEWKDTPDTSTTGDKPSVVVVTYPDGSQEEVEVTVHVTDPRTDADKYEPKGQDVNTTVGNEPNANDAIENGEDLPEDTTIEWKETPDVSTSGTKPAIDVVTYPDGSQDEVEVTVHVTDPRTDADKHEPKGQDVNTTVGNEPNASDAIENKDDLPEGTTIEWKDTPDVSTPGDKSALDVVTYPDGSQDEVEVTVHVADDNSEEVVNENDSNNDAEVITNGKVAKSTKNNANQHATLPQTGDDTQATSALSLLGVVAASLLGLGAARRKRN